MTTATAEPEAPPLTEELQRKIIRLNDECVAALHEFEIKNDEARAAHNDYKEKCKRLHEVISSTRVALPLFDPPAGVNGHAQVGAEAAEEEDTGIWTGERHAFEPNHFGPKDLCKVCGHVEGDIVHDVAGPSAGTDLEPILTAAGLSESVVATLRSYNLRTIEQLEHYCQDSAYDNPIGMLDGIGERRAQQIMKAVGEHKRQAEATAAEVLTTTAERTAMPTDSEPSTETPKRRRGRPRKQP